LIEKNAVIGWDIWRGTHVAKDENRIFDLAVMFLRLTSLSGQNR
jgi:hypothetical protein